MPDGPVSPDLKGAAPSTSPKAPRHPSLQFLAPPQGVSPRNAMQELAAGGPNLAQAEERKPQFWRDVVDGMFTGENSVVNGTAKWAMSLLSPLVGHLSPRKKQERIAAMLDHAAGDATDKTTHSLDPAYKAAIDEMARGGDAETSS